MYLDGLAKTTKTQYQNDSGAKPKRLIRHAKTTYFGTVVCGKAASQNDSPVAPKRLMCDAKTTHDRCQNDVDIMLRRRALHT